MISGIFDSHAHYDDSKFEGGEDGIIEELNGSGKVSYIVNCGDNVESSLSSQKLARAHNSVFFTAGIHPHYADEANAGAFEKISELLKDEKCVALGEIGLDYHYDFSPRDRQKEVFDYQMKLAAKADKPVCIHDREAHGDVFSIVCDNPDTRGMMHSYSGSKESAREYVKRGWYISFSGSLTFKNAVNLREVCAAVPEDRLLLETDAPYLAPVPMRGKTNNSGYIEYTAAVMAEIRGKDTQYIIDLTRENAKRFYGIE